MSTTFVNIQTPESGIVKDGLQVWLDSRVKSSFPSESSSPYIWHDLTGNNRYATVYPTSLSDIGSYGEEGPIYFNGSSGVGGALNYNLPTLTTTDDFTWSILFYHPINEGNDVIFGNRYDTAYASGVEFVKFTHVNFEYYSSGPYHIPYTLPENQFLHLCVTKNGTSFKYYSNGSLVGSRTTNINLTGVNPIYLAAGNGTRTVENSGVTFYQVLLYNIGLSENQVQQNFNAVRGRVGI